MTETRADDQHFHLGHPADDQNFSLISNADYIRGQMVSVLFSVNFWLGWAQ